MVELDCTDSCLRLGDLTLVFGFEVLDPLVSVFNYISQSRLDLLEAYFFHKLNLFLDIGLNLCHSLRVVTVIDRGHLGWIHASRAL